jgi:FkbM family methyltransferase
MWQARLCYARTSDWLLSIYHRLLLRFPHFPLPLRNTLRRVRLTALPEELYVRLGSTDWYVLEEIFVDKVYQPITERDLRDVRNVVDLGANTGFSLRLWQTLYPAARLIAVEPDSENLKMCGYNVRPDAGATCLVQACVAGQARIVSLDRSGGAWKFAMREIEDQEEDSIPAMTLPQILASCDVHEQIDLLKCDIEGAESELFSECADWISRVKNLVVELHRPYSSQRFLSHLDRAGARLQVYFQRSLDDGSELIFLQAADDPDTIYRMEGP